MRKACRAAVLAVVMTVVALAWAVQTGTASVRARRPPATDCQPQRDGAASRDLAQSSSVEV
jgi:hypothetical protein